MAKVTVFSLRSRKTISLLTQTGPISNATDLNKEEVEQLIEDLTRAKNAVW